MAPNQAEHATRTYFPYCVNLDAALARVAVWRTFGNGASTPVESQATSPVLSAPAKSERALGVSEKRRIHKLMKNAVTDARHIQMNLESYLLMPIQRVPRYRMLLEGLLACSPDSVDAAQPDALLVAAHSAIALVAQEMNERKRDSEGRQRLVGIWDHKLRQRVDFGLLQLYWQKRLSQGAFPSTLVQVHRSLIREGAGMLSRVAKSAFQPVAIVHPINGKTSCYKLPYLNIEISQKRLVSNAYAMCTHDADSGGLCAGISAVLGHFCIARGPARRSCAGHSDHSDTIGHSQRWRRRGCAVWCWLQ